MPQPQSNQPPHLPYRPMWFQEPKTEEQWLLSLAWVLSQDPETGFPPKELGRVYQWAVQVALDLYELDPYSELHPLDLRPGVERSFLRMAAQEDPQWALDLVELKASLPTFQLPKEPQAAARVVLMHLGQILEELEPVQPD